MQILSPPNSVTLLRIFLTPVFAFLFLEPDFNSALLSIIIFIIAAITDWYDGWIARKWNYKSDFGNFFDPLADKILVSTAFILFSIKGYMPFFMTFAIIFRDTAITFLRMYFERNNKTLNTSYFAKTKTFLQMVSIYILLCYHLFQILPTKNDFVIATLNIFKPNIIFYILLTVTFITIWTGVVYFQQNFETIKIILAEKRNKPRINIFYKIIGSTFYFGYFPFASGTISSFIAIILIYLFVGSNLFTTIIILPLLILFSIFLANKFEKYYGQDPSNFTMDEFVGMWISILFIPLSIKIFFIAFFVFRLFDIFKPWPANYFDKKPGGFAITLDDIIAGIYTNITLQIILFIFPNLK